MHTTALCRSQSRPVESTLHFSTSRMFVTQVVEAFLKRELLLDTERCGTRPCSHGPPARVSSRLFEVLYLLVPGR